MSKADALDDVRSLYFVSGLDEAGIAAGLRSGADAVCVDFEDLVPPARKDEARRNGRALLDRSQGFAAPGQRWLARVNNPATPYFADDVAALAGWGLDGVVVPTSTPETVVQAATLGVPLVAMIETAPGVRTAFDIASAPAVVRLVLGPGDLAQCLHLDRSEPDALLAIRSALVVDSAAAGIEGPFDIPGPGDDEGFERHVRYGRALGARGKFCFTPTQVQIVNRIHQTD